MKDINGVEILPGSEVMTQQRPGGILPPAPAVTGFAERYTNVLGKPALRIRYRKPGQDFDKFIDLEGKINQVIS